MAEPVPLHLRNAPTQLMKELDYGKGYRYAHDEAEGVAADMECLPPAHQGRRFYQPTDRGFEQEIRRRLATGSAAEETWRNAAHGLAHRRVRRRAVANQLRHLAEHLRAQRQDEREAIVPLHPADRDADELAVAVQHAAARHAGMAVGQAGHQVVRRPLADVAGRQDDALRVVVAEAEDRIGEVEPVARD